MANIQKPSNAGSGTASKCYKVKSADMSINVILMYIYVEFNSIQSLCIRYICKHNCFRLHTYLYNSNKCFK